MKSPIYWLWSFQTMQYFLKARFHFNKDQFADILLIVGIIGAISQASYT